MEVFTAFYSEKQGWSTQNFPELDSPQTLVLIFAAPDYKNSYAPITEVINNYPSAHIVGCSTSGEILGDRVYDESVCVCVAHFEHTTLKSATLSFDDNSTFETGQALVEKLIAPELKHIFVVTDGLINGSQLADGMNSRIPQSVGITGGLASDGTRLQETWVLKDGKPTGHAVTAVGFYGEQVRVNYGAQGGWDAFGLERRVTRSEGNVLYEIDEKPALKLLKDYLGDLAEGLPSTGLLFPLELRENDDVEKRIVRTILAVDEEEQSITYAGNIPQGYLAQFMKANFTRIINGAANAASLIGPISSSDDILSIAISCVGRRLLLRSHTDEELESMLDILPEGIHQIGFYSLGELSPYLPSSNQCELQNQTMTLTTIYEEA